jgi:hypothetical protein
MLNSDSIIAQLRDNSHVIRGMGIKRIGLFGSYIRGDNRSDSDIDILVEFRQGEEKYRNLLKLHEYLTGLFQTKIEIVTMGGLSPYIGPHILKEVRFVETT